MINNKKVYDCFLFYKEVEMLKLRLNSLQDYVDVFVISEATQTHSGEPCVPMSLAILDLFDKPIRDKIIVTQTVFPQHLTEPFEREHYQRDDMLQFITSNSGADAPSPDDILLLSDVDEIPNLKLYTGEEGVFNQKFYYYFLNMRHAHKWWAGTTAIYAKNCKSFRKLREEHWNRERLPFHGGWHYSMMGSVKLLQEKIKAFAHQEFNKEELLKEETLLKKIKERKDIFDRNFEKPFTLEPLDGSDWLLEHKDEYKDWVKPIKISLGMIVKNEEEILVKTLEAVRPIVDEYCIVDTGSTDKTHDIIKRYQPEVIEIPFEDFVTTKNKALEHCNGEYVLWMDADEILYKGHQNLLDWVNKDVEAVNCKITEGDANDYSITTCVYDRVRMWKNNGKWKFYGPGVHEVIVGENVTAVDDPNILVRHEHLKSDKAQTAKDRFLFYIELLNNFIKDNPNDTRAWFYLGRTYMDINERLMAISCFLKYLSIPGNTFRDEKFDTAYNIAKCYKEEGEYDKAISWCYKSLQYDYRRSEAYCVLGEIFFIKKDWSTAIKYYEKAVRTVPEDVILFLDAFAYNKTPKDKLTLCYYYNKEFKKSEVITDSLRQDMLPTVDQRIINNLWWCRKFTHMKIFMCLGYTPEPLYGGMLKEQGVHGVETTYLELSDVLSRLGHDVYLFCRTEKEHVYEDVHFIPYEKIGEYLPIEPTVIIASRWYDSFYLESKAKKIVWLQDAYYADPQGRKIFDDCSLYVCSSPWHRDYTYQRFGHDITPNKFKIIPLGIRKNLFDVDIKRDPYKVIYSSNPDRGLYILMNMWDKIVEKIPGIHLNIYYGWDGLKTWNDSVEWQQSVENQKNRVMNWVNAHSNITLVGRLAKEELAKEFLSATLCLYPNNFFETFCLTALETQASSVPMITTDMGAMSTTLKRDFNVLIPGSPFTDLYKNKFIEETVNIMKNKTMLNAFAKGCKLYTDSIKCDWTDIGEEWQQLIWNLF